MSKISRADWAATTPWDGITNKPASFGASDIGQLTAAGFGDGQIPVWNRLRGKFLPGSRTLPSPTPTPDPSPAPVTEISVTWDVPNLHALQTTNEDFYVVGAFVNHPVIVGAPPSDQFFNFWATIFDLNIVRISVQNLGLADLDLGEGIWRLRIFT